MASYSQEPWGQSWFSLCLRSQGQSSVALGLQRSQESISTADSLGIARANTGWVREAQSHHPSRAGRAEIGHEEERRIQGRKEMRWPRGRILHVCVCWGCPNFELELFHLFIQLLSNKYLWSTYCFPDTVQGNKV